MTKIALTQQAGMSQQTAGSYAVEREGGGSGGSPGGSGESLVYGNNGRGKSLMVLHPKKDSQDEVSNDEASDDARRRSRAHTPVSGSQQSQWEEEDQGVLTTQDYNRALDEAPLTLSQQKINDQLANLDKKEEEDDPDYNSNTKSGGKDATTSNKRKSSEPSQESGLFISCMQICANLWTPLV